MTEEIAGRILKRKLPPLQSPKAMREILTESMYGKIPDKPLEIRFDKGPETEDFAGKGRCFTTKVICRVPGGELSFPVRCVLLSRPGKHPFFIHINFRGDVPDKYMPTEEILDGGFSVLSFCYEDVTGDHGDFTDKAAAVLFPEGRGPRDAGKIAIWAWAAMRVLDYAYTLEGLDLTHACVCGHSRLGKTALLAASADPRFTHAYSNDSGCCGASLHRGSRGEQRRDICRVFPYWFTREFAVGLADPVEELPFDQHFLLGSLAPRPVLVGTAAEDAWADPASEFLAAAAASPAYTALGVPGLVAWDLPQPGDAYLEGNIGYHIRTGTHFFSRRDWQRLMEFMAKH